MKKESTKECLETTERDDNKTFDRIIIKQRATSYVGVESMNLTRNAIGMVLSGEKYIQQGDQTIRIPKGSIFYMRQGSHLVENIPSAAAPFEQILFYYTPIQLQRIIASFEETMLEYAKSAPSESNSKYMNVAVAIPSKMLRNLFTSTNTHYEYGGFINNELSERIKLMELIHYIISYEGGEMLQFILMSLDDERAHFEQVIHRHIFEECTISHLASECHRSLTSFKKDFSRFFGTPPHQWYQHQRLNYARLLLSTTNHSIAQIGDMCLFPNPSHFIKIFKRHYNMTPATYRTNSKKVKK